MGLSIARLGARTASVALILATCAMPLAGGAAAQGVPGVAGPYLAANQADLRGDYTAAADYYDQLIGIDPGNNGLVSSGLLMSLAANRSDRALALARMLDTNDSANQVMALTLLADAFRAGDYQTALLLVEQPRYQLNPLFTALITGWAQIGGGAFAQGLETFEAMSEADNSAMDIYGRLHHALALALAGDAANAALILDGDAEGPLHLNRMAMLAHISTLSQAERGDEALSVIDAATSGGFNDPTMARMRALLEAGEEVPFDTLTSPADGAAAVYAILASALVREEAERLGLVYGRLAVMIRPGYDEVSTLIADVLAGQGQYALAIETYRSVDAASPWFVTAEIGRADALRGADRLENAVEVLATLARTHPEDRPVHIALGDLLRGAEDFAPAADAYSDALALTDGDNPADWRLYYARAISYERTDRWPEAEADFRRALELNPEQPHVLNYLGYSLVEMRQDLDEALAMIESAVAQRPQDGFITDSLGWVLYRLGRYDEAVAPMERAVELEPVDPIINDHLGDVLWRVGRTREAEFQWTRALSFDPEPEDATRIRRKLAVGLDVVLAEEAEATPPGDAAETVKSE